jgi:starch synthase (maltosyl-transferring)
VATAYEPRIGRVPIRHLSPLQPEDLWPAKAYSGEVVPFRATVFKEGHDVLGVTLVLTSPAGIRSKHPMTLLEKGLDRWGTEVRLDELGEWRFAVQGYNDDWATWLHNAEIKIPAGIDVPVMLALGGELLARAAAADPASKPLRDAAKGILSTRRTTEARFGLALAPKVQKAIAAQPLASLVTSTDEHVLRVERTRAGLGAWYEFFPRSEGAVQHDDGSWTSGTFRTAAERLPAVAGMGFDVIYIPPIHPIGTAFRKGRNNSTTSEPGDPGSPYAIGSADGGHDAIHPELGDVDDFQHFIRTAEENGLEVALDFALQASPDHPWVTEHPEWFTVLPDGTIAYAENPPKKYQDIYPINFDTDPTGLSEEILRIVRYWIEVGVKIFRVDNPHTKPLWFWEWLLHIIAEESPEVIFLAEAFTRPPMMQSLAQVGFQQSYSYFTWRNTKEELEEFLTSVSKETSAFMRPNLFVNTHDILTQYLQFGGVPAYKTRAAIAATAGPTWGVYAGYELYEHVARPGSEENIDNEKYEFKARDFDAAEAEGRSLAPYIRMLNRVRRDHPSLGQLRNFEVHWSDSPEVLVYSKFLDASFSDTGRHDAIIVVANLDPHGVQETMVHLDPRLFGIDPDTLFDVTDLVTGSRFTWGLDNFVRLDPAVEPVHVLRVEFPEGN